MIKLHFYVTCLRYLFTLSSEATFFKLPVEVTRVRYISKLYVLSYLFCMSLLYAICLWYCFTIIVGNYMIKFRFIQFKYLCARPVCFTCLNYFFNSHVYVTWFKLHIQLTLLSYQVNFVTLRFLRYRFK